MPCLLIAAGVVVVLQAECSAQRFRFKRRFHADAVQTHQRPIVDADSKVRLPERARQFAPGPAKWEDVLGYDPRVHLDADRYSRYPKFIGGFHSSHFTDVGLPTGDKGFRGNGLYWTPW